MGTISARRPSRRGAWIALTAGAAGLLVLTAAWWFTHEPAPAVRVLWRDEVSAAEQARLERRHLLANRRAPHPDAPRSFAYDLLDTRRSNIEALVRDPGVADTNDIDRQRFEIPLDRAAGERWTWIAHRTPVLRNGRIRWMLVAALAALALFGLHGLGALDRTSLQLPNAAAGRPPGPERA